MRVLAIETSCDDTCAAVYDAERGLLSSEAADQDDLHGPFGGIVPELASRRHVETLDRLVTRTLEKAALPIEAMEAFAATVGPGLIGSLVVGLSYAKSLAFGSGKPLIGIDHLEGHLHSIQLAQPVAYPYLGVLVSGGHSAFYRVEEVGRHELLGKTQDDALGEVFDKVAKLLGFGYPGGAAIEARARNGRPDAYDFPRPLAGREDLRLSFSGLKTAVAQTWERLTRDGPVDRPTVDDLCAAFQAAAADTLARKLEVALGRHHLSRVVLVGGVAANGAIRSALIAAMGRRGLGSEGFFAPPLSLCRDNAAMIAWVAARRLGAGAAAFPLSHWEAYARR